MSSILVITVGRAGSTNLCRGLAETLNLRFVDEPFSPVNIPDVHSFYEANLNAPSNVIVKHIWWHTPKGVSYLKFLKKLANNFQHTLILTRRNTKQHFESLVNLKYRTQNKDDVFSNYFFEDIPKSFIENYKKVLDVDKLKAYNDNLIAFGKESNIEVVYYEDVYSDDIESNFKTIKGIINHIPSSFKSFLNNKNRQRISVRTSRLI